MYEIESRKVCSQILSWFISLVLFWKSNSSEKNVIVAEELDCNDIDKTENLEDSPRLVFINKECGNLIEVNDSGEITENISQKKSDVLQ